MSQESKKHSFLAEEGTPLEAVMDYIKTSQGRTLKGEIENWAAMFHYPHALYQSGASFEQVVFQANEAIRRLNQEITAMNTLINMMAIAEGKPPLTASHFSVMGTTPAGMSSPKAHPEVIDTLLPSNGLELEEKTKNQSKYFEDPF